MSQTYDLNQMKRVKQETLKRGIVKLHRGYCTRTISYLLNLLKFRYNLFLLFALFVKGIIFVNRGIYVNVLMKEYT